MKKFIMLSVLGVLIITLLLVPTSKALITQQGGGSLGTSGIHYLNVENIHAYKAVFNVSSLSGNYTYDVKSGRFWMPQGGNAQ